MGHGTKYWITNAPHADTVVVYARTAPESLGISAFLIGLGVAGCRVAKKLDKMGMRGFHTAELVFRDCEVPAENILGEPDGGVRVLMSGLDYERAVLAAGPLGIMQSCLDVVLPYVRERNSSGAPSVLRADAGQDRRYVRGPEFGTAIAHAVARACDAGRINRMDAAGAILLASENGVRTCLKQFRRSAVKAAPGSGRSSAICATPSSTISGPAPMRFVAFSSGGS